MSDKIYTLNELQSLLLPVFRHHDVRRAILFGSYGKGKADCRSDVDLLVDSDFGYAVTVKDGEPEFGAEHMESDVTITNRVKEGADTTEPESSPGGSGGSGGSGGQPEGVPSDARSVRTGDDTPIVPYVLLLAASACAAAAAAIRRKRAGKAGRQSAGKRR